jgi:hypothetical protein
LYAVFDDSRCPKDVLSLRDAAFANRFVFWAFTSFFQSETILGQEYFLEAIRLNPSLMNGIPSPIVDTFISHSIHNESKDHDLILTSIFEQLPSEAKGLRNQLQLAIAIGYLLKGIRAVIWGRTNEGSQYFDHAATINVPIDESYLGRTVAQLLDYGSEFGSEAVDSILHDLRPQLKKVFNDAQLRHFKSLYLVNLAFQNYQGGNYQLVSKILINGLAANPKYFKNLGVLTILSKSILYSLIRH